MKRILVLYYIIFLTFTFQSCQEAQLPIANYAKIDLSVDWMNYGFMLSANVEKSNDISIIEKGFVIQRNISDDEPYIYKLNPSDEFKANIEGNWGDFKKCKVYAYVNTSAGNFRSKTIDWYTGMNHAPIISSVTQIPEDNNTFLAFSGKLIIEGKYFSTSLKENKVWIGNQEYEVIRASMNKLEVCYNSWNTIGVYPLKLEVNSKMCLDEVYVEFKGQEFVSHTPLNPRYGEIVEINIKNYNLGGEYQIQYLYNNIWVDLPTKIIKVSDNKMYIRLFPIDKYNKLKVRFVDKKRWIYSPTYEIEMASLWEPTNYEIIGTLYTRYSFNSSRVYIHNFDYWNPKLQYFDATTYVGEYTNSPIPGYSNGDHYGVTMAIGKYVYVSYGSFIYDTSTGTSTVTPHYYCFDELNKTWNAMPDMGKSLGLNPMFIETEGDYIYLQEQECIYKYSPENNQKTILYSNIPSGVYISGYYKDELYFNDTNSLYRLRNDSLQRIYDFSMDNPNPLYCNADYTYCRIIGKYAYIKEQKGIFRLDISHDTPTLEPLGWVYIDESSLINDDIYIWPLDDNIFILQHQNYIGRIYKYVGTK